MIEFIPAADEVEGSLRLLQEYEEAASEPLRAWLALVLPQAREELRRGRATGTLWVGPKDEGIGIALWDDAPRLGRRVQHLYLAEGYRNAAALSKILEVVDAQTPALAGRLIVVPGQLPGLTEPVLSSVLQRQHFVRIRRPAMVRSTDPPLAVPTQAGPSGRLRPATDADRPQIERVSARAFAGGLSRLWFPEGDLARDASNFMDLLAAGEWGSWVKEASWVFEGTSGLLGASLVAHAPPRVPLLLSLMVLPEQQGRGLGRALLASTLQSLRERGDRELELNVIRENAPAFHLYESVGFRVVEGTDFPYWVRDPATGPFA